jgi:thioredoxin reductase
MQTITKLVKTKHNNALDVAIIGAGPAGFASTLAAKEANLRCVTIEQEELGGTVAHFPRRKLVMTQPADLPIVGKMRFKEVQKEDLIEFWRNVEQKTGITVNYNERVDAVEPSSKGTGFTVTTNKASYDVRAVLLAIGRRGSPRQLGVPGEELPKVAYRLIDAEQYRGKHVLVVGGGDSALEAATSIAAEPGTNVTLSYRSGAFNRAKQKNREKVDAAVAAGTLRVFFNSNVKQIHSDHVEISVGDKTGKLKNDFVIVSAGGILPTAFLKTIGINVETKWGTE